MKKASALVVTLAFAAVGLGYYGGYHEINEERVKLREVCTEAGAGWMEMDNLNELVRKNADISVFPWNVIETDLRQKSYDLKTIWEKNCKDAY